MQRDPCCDDQSACGQVLTSHEALDSFQPITRLPNMHERQHEFGMSSGCGGGSWFRQECNPFSEDRFSAPHAFIPHQYEASSPSFPIKVIG